MSLSRQALTIALLAAGLAGCATSTGEHVRAHRFPEACFARRSASQAERDLLEKELLHRTHVILRGRALGREEIQQRLGLDLDKIDMVLFHVDVVNDGHPCCSVEVSPRLEKGGLAWAPALPFGLFSEAGQGQTPVVPETKEEEAELEAIRMLIAPPPSERLLPGSVLHRVMLLVPPPQAPGVKDAYLVVTLRFALAETNVEEACQVNIERRFALPEGPSLGEQLRRFLDAHGGEIVLGEGRL